MENKVDLVTLMDPVGVVIIILLTGFLSFILISAHRFLRLPQSNPVAYLKRSKPGGEDSTPKMVLVGDSITHGTASANYVNLVESRLNQDPSQKIEILNAGINGEFAFNVLQRLDPIIRCEPTIITILIGTNDAYGSLTLKKQMKEQRKWKLPELPDAFTYRRYLTAIATQLKAKSKALIALLSIPTIGEDPITEEFAQSLRYGQIVKEVASATGVAYVPLNEAMVAYLKTRTCQQKYPFKWYLFTIVKSILARAFGKSWDKVAKGNGFQLHTDHLHLSPTGASMVADLITSFYKDKV